MTDQEIINDKLQRTNDDLEPFVNTNGITPEQCDPYQVNPIISANREYIARHQ